MLHAYWRLLLSLSWFSLFLQSTSFESFESSLFFIFDLRTSDRFHFERPPTRQMVVHGPAFVLFPNSPHVSIFNAMAGLVGAGIRSCALPKERNVTESHTFFPKTTVSWRKSLVSNKKMGLCLFICNYELIDS